MTHSSRFLIVLPIKAAGKIVFAIPAKNADEALSKFKTEKASYVMDEMIITEMGDPICTGMADPSKLPKGSKT